jgi:hypothetical protein
MFEHEHVWVGESNARTPKQGCQLKSCALPSAIQRKPQDVLLLLKKGCSQHMIHTQHVLVLLGTDVPSTGVPGSHPLVIVPLHVARRPVLAYQKLVVGIAPPLVAHAVGDAVGAVANSTAHHLGAAPHNLGEVPSLLGPLGIIVVVLADLRSNPVRGRMISHSHASHRRTAQLQGMSSTSHVC